MYFSGRLFYFNKNDIIPFRIVFIFRYDVIKNDVIRCGRIAHDQNDVTKRCDKNEYLHFGFISLIGPKLTTTDKIMIGSPVRRWASSRSDPSGEGLIVCPYNGAHLIRARKLIMHLVKCARSTPPHKLEALRGCTYNWSHKVPVLEYERHQLECPDKC